MWWIVMWVKRVVKFILEIQYLDDDALIFQKITLIKYFLVDDNTHVTFLLIPFILDDVSQYFWLNNPFTQIYKPSITKIWCQKPEKGRKTRRFSTFTGQ